MVRQYDELSCLGSLFNRQGGIVCLQNRQKPDVAFKCLLIPQEALELNNTLYPRDITYKCDRVNHTVFCWQLDGHLKTTLLEIYFRNCRRLTSKGRYGVA